MNAPAQIVEVSDGLGDVHDFEQVCSIEAWFVAIGIKPKQLAVDHCWWLAERWFLIEQYGQDEIQALMAAAFLAVPR